MAITKPDMEFIWASGGAIVEPSDTKKQLGWTAEVPPHQWENWIQNRQDNYLAHINERGIPEWDNNTNYLAAGLSYVQGSDGKIYKSVGASGPSTTVQNPTTDVSDTYWTVAFADVGAFLTQASGDARYAQLANNLSDLTNTTTARNNLSVYSKLESDNFGINSTRIDVASASTVNLTTSAPNTRHINITGTTAITGFTVEAGRCYFVRFAGVLTLTNGASIVTNTGADITAVPGDSCIIRATAANTVEIICYSTVRKYTQGSAITLSGTSVDVSGIPSWAKRITVSFAGMSGSGTSPHIIRLGTSSGVESSGYLGSVSSQGNGASQAQMSSGFSLEATVAAASLNNGIVTIVNLGGNIWCMSGLVSTSNDVLASNSSGSKSLSGVLDRIRLTTVGGVDTFDAGSFSVTYEG